jgi:uridine kinase
MLDSFGMFFIGIAGGSGSGKTTFARKILARVSDPQCAILHQDSYYLPSPTSKNFDHPDAFDWPLLRDHLTRLKNGEQVAVPVYDYANNRRSVETELVGPCQVILMEGIFVLWDPEFRSLFDLRIYLNVDADIRFIRRLHRDISERGRTVEGVTRQYYDTVRPMHREFLEPTRQYADLIVGDETDIAADVVGARVVQTLNSSRPFGLPVRLEPTLMESAL